jgi:hypothetical protein
VKAFDYFMKYSFSPEKKKKKRKSSLRSELTKIYSYQLKYSNDIGVKIDEQKKF